MDTTIMLKDSLSIVWLHWQRWLRSSVYALWTRMCDVRQHEEGTTRLLLLLIALNPLSHLPETFGSWQQMISQWMVSCVASWTARHDCP